MSAVLGSHIEMTSSPGQHYAIGTTFQSEEASLVLDPDILLELNSMLTVRAKPGEIQRDELIVAPMHVVQRGMSNFVRWLSQ